MNITRSTWKERARLLDASIGQARRFVYVSSVGVLGWPGVQGIDESFPTDVHSAKVSYHSTKAEAERVVRARGSEIEAVVASRRSPMDRTTPTAWQPGSST